MDSRPLFMIISIALFFNFLCIAQAQECGNIVCETGENNGECAIDCGGPCDGLVFEDFLNHAQVWFKWHEPEPNPLPQGEVDFIIGNDCEKQGFTEPQYIYVALKTIYGHYYIMDNTYSLKPNAYEEAVALTNEEIDGLFGGNYKIWMDVFQRAEVQKIHNGMFPEEPDLKPGVVLDADGRPVLDGNNKATPDSTIEEYNQGKTMVFPTIWSASSPTRFFWNYNSPAVREYLVRWALKKIQNSGENLLFIDNSAVYEPQIYDGDTLLHYHSAGDEHEQIELIADQTDLIHEQIKARSGADIILNGFSANYWYRLEYFEHMMDDSRRNFDGVMYEGRFIFDKESWGWEWCTDIEFVQEWINLFKSKGVKMVFIVDSWGERYFDETQSDSSFVYNAWLWFHLVADNNAYFYISHDYNEPMVDYAIYDYLLGMPLGEAYKEGKTWYRKYQRGIIVFDTTSGYLDTIKFIEENFCEEEICEDGTDNDCDGRTDEGCGCGNGFCESGEDNGECAIDCGSGLEDLVFSHYPNFCQIRFGTHKDIPQPEGKVEFTVGGSNYEGIPNYYYVSVKTIHGHVTINAKSAKLDAVALTEQEIDDLFNGDLLTKDKFQRAEIEKIHSELIMSNPELFPYGFELNYGVITDSNGEVILDSDNLASEDSSIEYYQQGKTIVQPTTYNPSYPTRFHFNYNNPAVREYAIRLSLKRLERNTDNLLFLDNYAIMFSQLADSDDNPLHYISPGDSLEQTEQYLEHSINILNEIKTIKNPDIIINGLRDNHIHRKLYFEVLTEEDNFDNIDGTLIEGRFWFDRTYVDWCTDVEFYLDWIEHYKESGRELVFAAVHWSVGMDDLKDEFQKDSSLVYRIWLWYHLVADENAYLYINDFYTKPMVSYNVYDYPLGYPLEEPHKEGNIWRRKYQRGTIVFDTSAGKLEAIKFIEENNCEEEICGDGKDNDCDGNIDDSDICVFCGNGRIENGEECDMENIVNSCILLGFDGGVIGCYDNCTLDVSGCIEPCVPTTEICDGKDNDCDGSVDENGVCCGNGMIDSGEHCDMQNISQTCITLGFEGGSIACFSNCTHDAMACIGECVPSEEVCDGFDNDCDLEVDENNTCCGNGLVDYDEECDGSNLTETCMDLDFDLGELSCKPDCTYNKTGCSYNATAPPSPTPRPTECPAGARRQCSNNTGICTRGWQACVDGGWGDCNGTGPSAEICDKIDNDCDGEADDGLDCDCYIGEAMKCGNNWGECVSGMRYCRNGKWGDCMGERLPIIEICDNKRDDDCDGYIDNNCTDIADAKCIDGEIPEKGCFCGDAFYSAGYCYGDAYIREKPAEFPWILLSIFGVMLLLVLLAEVIHESHKDKKRMDMQTLEKGFRYM